MKMGRASVTRTPMIEHEIISELNDDMGNDMWKPQFKPNELHHVYDVRVPNMHHLFALSIKAVRRQKGPQNALVSFFAEFPSSI